jgi:hypothetical protein
MKRSFLIVLIALLMLQIMNSATLGFAQDTDDCPTGTWVEVAAEIYVVYDGIRHADTPSALERAAELQRLRRCLDAAPREDENDEAYTLLQNALNLTVDSIISAEIEQEDTATTLMDEADMQSIQARDLIIQDDSDGDELAEVVITSPADGSTLPSPIQVVGTYDENLVDEENPVWLYVLIDGRVYPQAYNGCPGDEREPLPYSPFDDSWSLGVGLGGPGDNGKEFQLILVRVNGEMDAFLNEAFDGWCSSQVFEGLSLDDAAPRGSVTRLQIVSVIRNNPEEDE